MTEKRVSRVEREPEVLAAAPGRRHVLVGELLLEVGDAGQVPTDGAGVEDADAFDGVADDVCGDAAADDLDLGQLGHG